MNEFKYVQDLLNKSTYNNKDLGDKPSATLNLLARYYREIGKTDDEIKNLLDNFLKSCLKDSYKPSKWIDSIFYQVKKSGKYSLKKVDEVTVTKSEIDTIQNVKGKARQKVLFTLLILAKFYNAVSDTNNNWCNMEYKKIFKLANVQLSTDNQALLMNDLYSLGLIKYSKNISKLNVSVNFIDNDSDVVLTLLGEPPGTYPTLIEVPSKYEIYNKYDEFLELGKCDKFDENSPIGVKILVVNSDEK